VGRHHEGFPTASAAPLQMAAVVENNPAKPSVFRIRAAIDGSTLAAV